MVRCVVPVFNPRQVAAPFAQPLVGEAPKILFYTAVDEFYLSVGLWVVCGAKLQLGARNLEKFLPKSVDEDQVSVANDGLGHPVEFDDPFHKLFGHSLSSKGWVKVRK